MRTILNSSLLLLVLITVTFFILNDNVFGDIKLSLTNRTELRGHDSVPDSKTGRIVNSITSDDVNHSNLQKYGITLSSVQSNASKQLQQAGAIIQSAQLVLREKQATISDLMFRLRRMFR